MVLNGYWFSLVLNGSQWFSMVTGSHWLSMVLSGSQWFSVVLNGYYWFPACGSHQQISPPTSSLFLNHCYQGTAIEVHTIVKLTSKLVVIVH